MSAGMLVKFETKSNRVKGLAFHPKRPWLLASLHNGAVQLWDYRMGTLLDKYEEHEGPVRGCAFHPTQSLFVTGGDDGKIKVFNYQQRRCLFTLTGHMDYIRTVFFHHEAPWIVSASDDQTVRVWNWQSRTCLAVLTGHSHYVMCAQFHPREDLLVSASLDQTIRVWDIGSLRRKHSSPAASPYGGDSSAHSPMARSAQIDLFSAPEGQTKFILEGHDRGVNWVQFHPSKPIIVSGSDDRSVKLWRYNDSRAWETDTFRGHFNNISCVLFHPHADLIISNSEDKTLRIWDYTKRGSQPIIHRRDSDRFWILAAHPSLNLVAAGHDNGFTLFKLEHERPAYCVFEDSQLFFLRDRTVMAANLDTAQQRGGLSSELEKIVANLDDKVPRPATFVYSASDNALLLSSASAGTYNLLSSRGGDSIKKGAGSQAVFIARNRFAVLDVGDHQIHIKALDNTISRSIPCAETVVRMLPSSPGTVLLCSAEEVELFDIQQEKILAKASLPGIKYAVWSADGNRLALFGSSALYVVDRRTLSTVSTVRESITLKSAVWDARGILFFTNSHHLKYLLPNGDVGVICTVQAPLYLIRVKEDCVAAIDRSSMVHYFNIDPTEVLFKLALWQGDQTKVLDMIENANLMGQSIIAYLRQKGYAEIALGFVRDPATRLELALECCDLEAALAAAKLLDRAEIWNTLADEALMMGNFVVAEECLLKVGNTSRLSFIYLMTGNTAKLQAMTDDAHVRGDVDLRLQNDLFLGDNVDFANALVEAGVPSLAYLACKSAGLEIEGQEIAAQFCPDKAAVASLVVGRLAQPQPIVRQSEPWPLTGDPVKTKIELVVQKPRSSKDQQATSTGMDRDALVSQAEEAHGEFEQSSRTLPTAFEQALADVAMGDNGGWDLDDPSMALEDVDLSSAEATQEFIEIDDGVLPAAGPNFSENLTAGSRIPFYYLAAGNIEEAIKLLSEQCGITNLAPLEPFFVRCMQGCSVPILGFNGATLFFSAQKGKEGHSAARPRPVMTLEMLKEECQAALQLTTAGKFSEASKLFENTLLSTMFVAVGSADEENEVLAMIGQCREYLRGLRMEQERKETLSSNDQRSLSLACYFSLCALRNDHLILAIRSALTQAYKLQCLGLAGKLARRLLQCDPPEATALQARKVLAVTEKLPLNHADPITVDMGDATGTTIIDSRDFLPLKAADVVSSCPFCQAPYVAAYAGSLCAVCRVATVGQPASGLCCYEE